MKLILLNASLNHVTTHPETIAFFSAGGSLLVAELNDYTHRWSRSDETSH